MNGWNDSYSVGIDTFDDDHKKLFAMLGFLESAVKNRSHSDAAIFKTIGDLSSYAEQHFGREEDAMLKCGYPDFEKHKKEHDGFKGDIFVYRSMTAYGTLPPAEKVLLFIRGWLENHILKTDKEYVQCLTENGFKG